MTSRRIRSRVVGESGVTLVELMAVLVIIAIGFLALTGVQTQASRDVTRTGLHSRALSIGQAQMEVARAAGFAGAQPDTGAVGVFNWRTDVAPVAVGLNRVRVTVTWAAEGIGDSLQLDNMVSRR